ncbi:TAXI family TRAP transporter solute-binding subunit [Rhodopseudomonas parapalustris]
MASPDGSRSDTFRNRRRRNRARFALAAVLTFILVAVGVLALVFYELRPVSLKIAVGPGGGDDLKLVQALAQTFARDRAAVRLVPLVTGGATPSIEAFRDHKADLAVTRADLDLPADAQAVAVLRKNVVVLWAPSSAGKGKKSVKTIADLAGRRVGVIGRTPANVKLFDIILAESGVASDKVQKEQFATGQLAEMARDPSLDAFLAVGPLDSKITGEAIAATAKARGDLRFLPIDIGDAIAKKYPIYESEEIPGSIFSTKPARPEDKVDTVSVNHLIIARQSLSSVTVTKLARQIFAARQQIAREMPLAGKIEAPDTEKDAAIPAHRGAAAFIDGTDRTFMERNSDYIWGLVLLLSGLGSAGAWFRSYLTRDEREAGAKMRDHALAMVAKARKAESLEALEALQHEIDQILRHTLDCYDDGAIEDLEPFGLVLEQFHHAVLDRRAALTAAGPELVPAQPAAHPAADP